MRTLEEWWPKGEQEEVARLSCICEVQHEEEVLEWVIEEGEDQGVLGPRNDETDLHMMSRIAEEEAEEYAKKEGIPVWQAWEELAEGVVLVEAHERMEEERRREQQERRKMEERRRTIEEVQEEWKTEQTYKQRRRRRKTERERIGILKTIEPEGFNVIQDRGEWEELELAVDSGATETVVNENMVATVEVKDGAASRRGVQYEVANGTKIPNLGEKTFTAVSDEGSKRRITAQVCDVNKALLSVKRMTDAGNRVVFDSEGSYVEDKQTRERMWLKEEGGMYVLKVWVPRGGF